MKKSSYTEEHQANQSIDCYFNLETIALRLDSFIE